MKKKARIIVSVLLLLLGLLAYTIFWRIDMSKYYWEGIYSNNCTIGNPSARIRICGEKENFDIVTFTGNEVTFRGNNWGGAVYIPVESTGLRLQVFTEGTGNRIFHTYVISDFLGQKEIKPALSAFEIFPSLRELSAQTEPNTAGVSITFDPHAPIRFDREKDSELLRNTFLDKGGTLEGVMIQFGGISGENVTIQRL